MTHRAALLLAVLLLVPGPLHAALSRAEMDVLSGANASIEAGDLDAARSALEAFLAEPGLSRDARGTGGMTLAYVLAKQDDEAAALARYEALLAGNALTVGQRTTVLYTAAQLAFLLDRHEDALRHYRRYRVFEESPAATRKVFLAQILYRLERYEEMVEPLLEVVDEYRAADAPVRTEWLRLLGFACEEAEDAPCLEDTLTTLYEREPSEAAARRAVAAFLGLGDGPRTARAIAVHRADHPDEGFAGPLHEAAARGDLHALAERVAAGDALDEVAGINRTPLQLAAWFGHVDVAEALLAAGADLHAVNGNDENAMVFAAFGGHPELVRLLRAAGADARSVGRYTPFQLMAGAGATDLVLELLDAYPDQLDSHGGDALLLAILDDHDETVRVLLERGADVHHRREGAPSLLELAAGRGDARLVEWLLAAGAGGEAYRDDLDGALLRAARETDAAVAPLLAAGADPTIRTTTGQMTPLWLAAGWGNEAAVRALLAHGVEVDAVDEQGRSPLQMAARTGHFGIFRHLLDAGADVERRYADGRSVLTMVAIHGDVELVDVLLASGADPDGGRGWADAQSPLAGAVVAGELEVVDALLAAGAELVPEEGGPHHHVLAAVLNGDAAMVARLLDAGLSADGPVSRLEGWDSRRLARFLRSRGFERIARDDATETWQLAAPVWQPEAEDVTFVLPRRRTPLTVAELVGHVAASGYGIEQWMDDLL